MNYNKENPDNKGFNSTDIERPDVKTSGSTVSYTESDVETQDDLTTEGNTEELTSASEGIEGVTPGGISDKSPEVKKKSKKADKAEQVRSAEEEEKEEARSTLGFKLMKIGIGIIALVAVIGVIAGMLRGNAEPEGNTNEVAETTEITTTGEVGTVTEELDINEELAQIVDDTLGVSGSTTTDEEELWQLYLLPSKLTNYAVYVDTTDNELSAIIIAEVNDREFFNSSMSLVKSGFIGGLSDNNNIVVSGSYTNQVGEYDIVIFGENSDSYGETITSKLQELVGSQQ